MIPEAFDVRAAGSVAEALEHMRRGAQAARRRASWSRRCKLRLSAPEALVDIARIPELSVSACTAARS